MAWTRGRIEPYPGVDTSDGRRECCRGGRRGVVFVDPRKGSVKRVAVTCKRKRYKYNGGGGNCLNTSEETLDYEERKRSRERKP
ncbi:hypothetical protein E2C01_044617 [Portunus trituberculatus]|uniref:Uncharacterized protein n=1 Tax=Portunus trituberculatus TaxID=210409 RepID=A0A5B7G0I3_PORTR|nr:hypothetical protein [Portunus trituberculatus]